MRIGISRLSLLGAVSAALIVAGACSNSDSPLKSSNGNVRFVLGGATTTAAATLGSTSTTSPTTLNDGSGRTITSASITISSMVARNLGGQLIDVTMDLPATVDLISLVQGGTFDLPMGSLPVDSYDQIVVVIRALHVVLSDGTQIDVTPPGGGWTAIVPTDPFDVVDGQVTTVTLHFHGDRAFQWVDGQLDFHPEFDCQTDHHHRGDSQH